MSLLIGPLGLAVFAGGCARLGQFTRAPERPAHEASLDPHLREAASSTVAADFDLEDAIAADIEARSGDLPSPLGTEPVVPVLTVTGTVTFDLPMSEDERVQMWVDYLTGRGRHWFERWLERSTRYVPLFWSILDEYELPRDLVFLSMIESGFSTRAYSFAHASGPWQFMEPTARMFGLQVGFWVDERRDFEKSTRAAASYLTRLHRRFGDWHLAMAAYNAGEGRVARALRRTGRTDFWTVSRTSALHRETRQYVPKILAAAQVAKRADRHGFVDVEYLAPLPWEVRTVTVATDLATLAAACGGFDASVLRDLNPALRFDITPPGEAYEVRVPLGSGDSCEAGLDVLDPALRVTYRYDRLQPGEDVLSFAARHGVSMEEVLKLNRKREEEVDDDLAGLIVPVSLAAASEFPIETPTGRGLRERYRPPGVKPVVHVVRPGQSLYSVARRHRVSVRMLRLWNGLWRPGPLRVGKELWIYPGGSGPSAVASRRTGASASTAATAAGRSSRPAQQRHRVRAGESLWTIAQRYRTTVDRLLAKNRLDASRAIQPGQLLRIQ